MRDSSVVLPGAHVPAIRQRLQRLQPRRLWLPPRRRLVVAKLPLNFSGKRRGRPCAQRVSFFPLPPSLPQVSALAAQHLVSSSRQPARESEQLPEPAWKPSRCQKTAATEVWLCFVLHESSPGAAGKIPPQRAHQGPPALPIPCTVHVCFRRPPTQLAPGRQAPPALPRAPG